MRFLSAVILLFCFVLLSLQKTQAQNAAQKKIKGLATQRVRSLCAECKVTAEIKWMPNEIEGIGSAQIEQLQFTETGLPRGYQTANIVYIKNGQPRPQKVQLFIKLMQKLPIANKRIKRNQKILAGDLIWRMKDITRMQRLPVASKEKIAGKAAEHIIQKGDAILLSDLQQVPIIKAGDNVKMIYRAGGVEVALGCRARQARAKGERIRVYSKETRKTYIGKVLTPSKVIWEKTL